MISNTPYWLLYELIGISMKEKYKSVCFQATKLVCHTGTTTSAPHKLDISDHILDKFNVSLCLFFLVLVCKKPQQFYINIYQQQKTK